LKGYKHKRDAQTLNRGDEYMQTNLKQKYKLVHSFIEYGTLDGSKHSLYTEQQKLSLRQIKNVQTRH